MDALLPRHPSAALDVVTCSPGPAALLNAELANAARHGQPLRAFDSFKDRQGTASGLLEPKAGALDAVPFDSWKAQPVDKIPATSAAADGCVPTVGLRSWQFAVTGKLAAAQVLADLEAKHITNGGPKGAQAVAEEYILDHKGCDDSFYIIDLGNVNRMLRAVPAAA